MAMFQGFLLLVIGLLLLATSYRSQSRGWLPFGSNGLKGRLDIRRDGNPMGFWILVGLYALAGLGMALFGLLILSGSVPPLLLRGGTPG